MDDPPTSLFSSIETSYDISIVYYFQIIKWNLLFMFIFSLCNLPNLIFSAQGTVIFGSSVFQLESLSVANLNQDSNYFVLAVLCDVGGVFIFIVGIAYLRYKGMKEEGEKKVSSIAPWSVEVSGFPPATIDPEDLRPIIQAQTYEIYLVRNFQGTLQLMKQKAHLERLIRLESKKLQLQSQQYTQAEIYIRQDYIRVLKNDVQDLVKELGEKFNLFLAPDDLESIRAYVVFKNKQDRDHFYQQYNTDCLVRNGIYVCYKQSPELQLRNLYNIYVKDAPDPSEIKWDNMDFINNNKLSQKLIQLFIGLVLLIPLVIFTNIKQKQSKEDPLKCQADRTLSNCLTSDIDSVRFLICLVVGIWMVFGIELGVYLLNLIILKERQIYIVREQINIFWRLLLYMLIYAFVIPILMTYQFIGDIIFIFSSLSDEEKNLAYSDNIDRKWIVNHSLIFFWMSVGYTLINLINILVIRCHSSIDQNEEDLKMLGNLITEENEDNNNKPKQGNTNNQSNQTLFLLNLDDSNQNHYSQSNLDLIKPGKPLRRDSQIVNNNPTFMTGRKYAKLILINSVGLLLSPAQPILPFLATIQLISLYMNEKYLLLFYNSYNEQSQIKLKEQLKSLGVMTLKLLTFILLIHLLIAIEVYGSPSIYQQNGLGSSLKWDDYNIKYLYKIGTVIPASILALLLLLVLLVDLIYNGLKGTFSINMSQIDQVQSQQLDDHITNLIAEGALRSYNLRYHDEFKEIIKSQKQESIRATLNQFKT